MASGGKKKTTMAKLARENKLRERRVDKQARKDARKQVAPDRAPAPEGTVPGVSRSAPASSVSRPELVPSVVPEPVPSVAPEPEPSVAPEPGASAAPAVSRDSRSEEAVRAFLNVGVGPSDPRAKEVALIRLRESPDEQLAVFEDRLRDDALDAGASEQEVRQAQRDHPGHGA